MLLSPLEKRRGLKRERLLRVLLTHEPAEELSKRALGRLADTTDAWAVKFTNGLENEGLLDGTNVLDVPGVYRYWQRIRIPPNTLDVALQQPVETIQEANHKHAFTTYHAENVHQGFLFPSKTSIYVDPDDVAAWNDWITANALVGGGNTEFRVADEHVFYHAETVNGLTTVCVPQLILDLLDEGGPCVEAGERLMEVYHG